MARPSDFPTRRVAAVAAVLALVLASCASSSRSPRPSGDRGAPVSPTAYATLENDKAFRLITEHRYAEAESALRDALDHDDRHGPAHNNLGLVYAKLGRPYDAARQYEAAARLMPRSAEPLNNLGLVLEEAGKLSDAVDAYAAARRLNGDEVVYLANLARARVRRGDRGDEVVALLESLRSRSNDPQWQDWARLQLIRLKAAAPQTPVGTSPATNSTPHAE